MATIEWKCIWYNYHYLILLKAADKKECADLKPWVPDIGTMFWYCSQHAGGSTEAFLVSSIIQYV